MLHEKDPIRDAILEDEYASADLAAGVPNYMLPTGEVTEAGRKGFRHG